MTFNFYLLFHFRRRQSRGVARGEVFVDLVGCQGARRARHSVQLSEDRDDHGRNGLQALGHRAAMLPNDHDEDRSYQTNRVHRLP